MRLSFSDYLGEALLADLKERLAAEVLEPSSGQSSGTQLAPNVPLGGLDAAATEETCSTGPASDASLIVILRAANLGNAIAGSYSGTLTLVLASQ